MFSFLIAEFLLIFFVEQGDWIYVSQRMNIRATVPPEVPWSQDRQTGTTADEIQHVWRKVDLAMSILPHACVQLYFSYQNNKLRKKKNLPYLIKKW